MVCPNASGQQASTDFICSVKSKYEITFPQNVMLSETDKTVGFITIQDLLLESDEYLTIEVLNKGKLINPSDSTQSILYKIDFITPSKITHDNVGDSYKILIEIDEDANSDLISGIYSDDITFNVYSSLSENAVISASATISLEVLKKPVVTLKIKGDNGTVTFQGFEQRDGATIAVDKDGNLVLFISPFENYRAEILLNGKDVSNMLIDGKLTLTEIISDCELEIRFVKKSPPGTGIGNMSLLYIVWMSFAAVFLVIVAGKVKKKQ